jgi:thiosulfate/3-mercaptopyruvate sulfurtransferase
MATQTLTTAARLRAMLAAGQPVTLIDCSFDLADPAAGERQWLQGHLPEAHYLHLDRDLSGAKTGRNGRHPLPERAAFARTLARCGVTPGVPVLAMDRQGGVYAARLWWMLRWMGHAQASVLDGGPAAWVAGGGTLAVDPPDAVAAPPYPDRPPLTQPVDAAAVLARLGRSPLIDARAPERFRGEVEPLDPVAGHIPGALNRFFKDNFAADGLFKPPGLLRAEFTALLGSQAAATVVHSCGSGVTACHNLLAMEHAGLEGSALFAGSWSAWCADPELPVARG